MERCLSIHHLKEDDTNRPDVGFVAILTLLNDLRCHVQWRTADSTVSLMQFVESLREAKVSDLNAEVGRHEVHVLEELLLLSFVHSIQKFFVYFDLIIVGESQQKTLIETDINIFPWFWTKILKKI